MREVLIDSHTWEFDPARKWEASINYRDGGADGFYFQGVEREYLFVRVKRNNTSVAEIVDKVKKCLTIDEERWFIVGSMSMVDNRWLKANYPVAYDHYWCSIAKHRNNYYLLTRKIKIFINE